MKDKERDYYAPEPNYHTTKWFSEKVLAVVMKKTKNMMKKLVCLSCSILDLSQIEIYEIWFDYIKKIYKNDPDAQMCYIGTDGFVICIKRFFFVLKLN